MKTIIPALHYLVLKLLSQDTETKTASGLLVVSKTNATKLYEVVEVDESLDSFYDKGCIVLIKGYPDIVQINGETYYIVHEDNVIAEVAYDKSVLEE